MNREADHVLGLDLGQAQDYSALTALERRWVSPPGKPDEEEMHLTVKLLKRWELKTSYTQIVEDVRARLKKPPLDNPLLAVDQTGVGAAVVDMFKSAELPAILRPVLITGGHETSCVDGIWHVPKKELVSSLQVMLQSQRLKIADVKDRDILVRELENFRIKVSVAGNESYEAHRERDHDDMVLAVAMATWLAEQCKPTPMPRFIDVPRFTLADREDRRRREGYSRGLFGYGRYPMQSDGYRPM